MTAGIIRLIAERTYHKSESEHLGDSRVFDVLASESKLADRIEDDMKKMGWEIYREEL